MPPAAVTGAPFATEAGGSADTAVEAAALADGWGEATAELAALLEVELTNGCESTVGLALERDRAIVIDAVPTTITTSADAIPMMSRTRLFAAVDAVWAQDPSV